jgi:hypothetical protein
MKVALADVLWSAANEWLHPRSSHGWAAQNQGLTTWSCHAIQAALTGKAPADVFDPPQERDGWEFIRGMNGGDGLAIRYMDGDDPQGVRYMWLLLAMHAAEDENIYVEVTK